MNQPTGMSKKLQCGAITVAARIRTGPYTQVWSTICTLDSPLKVLSFLSILKKGIRLCRQILSCFDRAKHLREKHLHDFSDYVDCIDGVAIQMLPEDFLDLKNYLIKGKDTRYPGVADIGEIQFKNTTKMFWKTSFEVTAYYKSGEFLLKKFREVCRNQILLPLMGPVRGLNLKTKEDIITKLLGLMPTNRRRFWSDLSDNAECRPPQYQPGTLRQLIKIDQLSTFYFCI